MPKALVVSLGEQINPIIKSIEEHKPDYLFFFVSKESIDISFPKIKELLREKSLSPKIDFCMVRDVEDLVHCYEKASELAVGIEKQGVASKDVVVDYTTGTRTMTAALVLATITKGYKFSYVGGKERTKEGLGIVVSGTEEIKTALSPWQILYVEERKKIALFFNSYQFSESRDVADRLAKSLGEEYRAIYKCLSELIEGYRLWDSFKHDSAFPCFEEGMKKLPNYLKVKNDSVLSEFLKGLGSNLSFLKNMRNKTNGFKELHFTLVFDLFHNAKRRANEGKYDDAIARLYRALEMIGQIEFKEKFGCETSDVKSHKLPESLREEMEKKHTAHDGKIKIPLFDTFRLLKEKESIFGRLFFEREEEMKKILATRNNSILAHGVIPVSSETFEKLSSIVEDSLKHTNADYKVEFPKLRWE